MGLKYDSIGSWSIIKLEIIQKYAQAYSKILSKPRKVNLYHVYIDAFAGAGKHRRKDTGDFVPGSPQIALEITPPFKEYHFVDIDSDKANELLLLYIGGSIGYECWYVSCAVSFTGEPVPEGQERGVEIHHHPGGQ